MSEIEDLQLKLREFAKARNWEPYHTPRNLILAIGSELGELQAEVRWQTDEDLLNKDPEGMGRITNEMADVAIFLLRLFDVMGVDFISAIDSKLEINDKRKTMGPNFQS